MNMTPLPWENQADEVVAWRLDRAQYASTWDSGIGAETLGGRWNRKGTRAVYASLDPAAAMSEVAVHVGFKTLDTVAHVLTAFKVRVPQSGRVLRPADVPNPNWLIPGTPSLGQQEFGTKLLAEFGLIFVPSSVSKYGWNLVLQPGVHEGKYELLGQTPFALDTRLHLPG